MNARRLGKKVRKFASYKELVNYTCAAKKFYPKDKAKCDVVKVLLKVMSRQH